MGKRNYLIDGVSGTGKTSVCNELQRRGYHAIHGDRELAYLGDLRRSRLFGQLPGRNKLKIGSRLLVSPFPEIKFILCCCGVL